MNATKRRRLLYKTLLDFTENNYASFDIDKFPSSKGQAAFRLITLKYLDETTNRDVDGTIKNLSYEINNKGWKFLWSYEKYRARKYTNIILICIGIPPVIYYLIEIWITILGNHACQ